MPPLALHMGLARELTAALRHPTLEADLGACYLGSTTPDIRVITRWERERTHFFDLERTDHQDGVEALFETYPELADRGEVSPSTAAFLAGYISHLVMDEAWIEYIYRPFFGARSTLGGDVRANVMDRVLQYELDRRERSKKEVMDHVRQELAGTALEVYVGFIDHDSLEQWRRVSLDVAGHEPDWQRFRLIAGRHLRDFGVGTPEAVDEFMKDVPPLLEETIRHVGWDRIESFLHQSRARSRQAIKEYLG